MSNYIDLYTEIDKIVRVFITVNDTCGDVYRSSCELGVIVWTPEYAEVLMDWFRGYRYIASMIDDEHILIRHEDV